MSISVASVADLGGTPPGSQPAWALTGDDLLAELDELHRAVAALQTRRLEVLARFDELGHAKELGARGTVELLSLRHRIDPAAVRRDLRLATALPKYDAVAAALPAREAQDVTATDITATDARADAQAGTDVDADVDPDPATGATGGGPTRVMLHPGQAEVIVSALERVPSTVPVADIEVAERALVTAAESLAPRDLRRLAEAAVDRLDPDGPEPDEEKARDQRRLYLSRGGYAELFQALIDAGAKPKQTEDGKPDPRTHGQRQADSLIDVLRRAAAVGGLPAHGGIRPQISVTISLDDLLDAGRHATGDPTFGTGLSAAAVRMLACDASIIPIILGSESQPLDVGQDARSVTPAIRRALIARDGGCVIPGCGAPPGHCDGHHIVHWSKHGPTSVDNTVLLCPAHHRAVHAGTWTVRIVDGRVQITRPAWADPDPPPRDPTPRASDNAPGSLGSPVHDVPTPRTDSADASSARAPTPAV